MKIKTRNIVSNAIVAAAYFVLTLATYPISFLGIQFRVAEILILLCFFRKDYLIGCTLGCIIANLFSSIGFIDVLFGSIATLLAGLAICFCKHLIVAIFMPVIFNAFIVGFELYHFLAEPFWISVGLVALGEMVVMILGYVVFSLLKKNKNILIGLGANQNLDFKI